MSRTKKSRCLSIWKSAPFTISSLGGFPSTHSSENLIHSQALFPAGTQILYLLNYFTEQSVWSYFSYLYFQPAGSTSQHKLLIVNRVHELNGHTIPMLPQIFPFSPVLRFVQVTKQFWKIPCHLPTLLVRGVHHFSVTVSLNAPSLLLPPVWLSPAEKGRKWGWSTSFLISAEQL